MKKYFICYIIIGLIFLTSCSSVKNISIEVLEPAKSSIPLKIKKIQIVNRSNFYNNNSINKSSSYNDSIYYDSLYSTECLFGLIDELNSGGRFDSINTDSIINISANDSARINFPIEENKIDSLCKENNSDALIELFKYKYCDEVNFNYLYALVIVNYNVKTISGWRLYFPDNEGEYYEDIIYDTISWSNFGFDYDEALQKIPYIEDAFLEAAYKTGGKYAAYLTPHWVDTKRMYYKFPISKIEKINLLINNNDWKSVVDIWEKYTNNKNYKKAAKASYNIALAYEMQGELKNALFWAEKSFSLFNSEHTKKYIKILKNRIEQIELIDEQMSR